MTSSSVGGVGTNQGPGIASTVLRHVTFDAAGDGTDDNGTYTWRAQKPSATPRPCMVLRWENITNN